MDHIRLQASVLPERLRFDRVDGGHTIGVVPGCLPRPIGKDAGRVVEASIVAGETGIGGEQLLHDVVAFPELVNPTACIFVVFTGRIVACAHGSNDSSAPDEADSHAGVVSPRGAVHVPPGLVSNEIVRHLVSSIAEGTSNEPNDAAPRAAPVGALICALDHHGH